MNLLYNTEMQKMAYYLIFLNLERSALSKMIKELVLPVVFGDSKTGKNKNRSLSVWKTEKGF